MEDLEVKLSEEIKIVKNCIKQTNILIRNIEINIRVAKIAGDKEMLDSNTGPLAKQIKIKYAYEEVLKEYKALEKNTVKKEE